MEKVIVKDGTYTIGYHTQECREKRRLDNPIKCSISNAWLGIGYYFWTDVEFAKYWGEDFKSSKTGHYEVYAAHLELDNCINAVFNETHYFFFRRCLEEAIAILEKGGKKVSLKRVHEFLSDHYWDKLGITGIVYDDLPFNPKHKPNRKYSVIEYKERGKTKFLYYKKRIQIVMFSLKNIHNFGLHLEKQS